MAKAGDVLGDFEILREVGRGSMGVVYEATQRSLGRHVAVKILTPAAAGDPVWVERFHTEATAVARLSHPGILPVFAVGEDGLLPWFAMEFVEGKDVADLVSEGGPMDPREAARIVRDAALALDHAHLQGVVHRDVKPSNLMVRKDGRVVLTDFGLAKHVGSGSLTTTGSLVGTPYYMSPEQALGDHRGTGPKTDVYGLGVTLYEMLVGRPPFVAENAVALLRMIAEKEPPPPGKLRSDLPRDLETIVLAAMEKTPEKRYVSCRDLADDLDRWLRDEPISRRRPGPVERLRRFVHRNRAATVAVGGALVLLAGGYAVFGFLLAAKEAEIDERIEAALRKSQEALDRGDVAEAEKVLATVAAAPNATPAQKDKAVAVLGQAFRKRTGPRARGTNTDSDGDVSIEDAVGSMRGTLPDRMIQQAMSPASLTLETDPVGATIEAQNLLLPDAEPLRLVGPLAAYEMKLGVWRLVVTAKGRVPLRTTLALLEKDGKFETEIRLPRADEVPAGMIALGGQSGRAASPRFGVVMSIEIPPFLIDRREVSVGEYAAFLASLPEVDRPAFAPTTWIGGRAPAGSDALPVTGVTWEMAEGYAAAQGKRLPTRGELELAALDATTPEKAARIGFDPKSFRGTPNVQGGEAQALLPVDRADASVAPSGVSDALGNAAEWSGSTPVGDPWHVLVVGGSFREAFGPQFAARFPAEASETVGFRCAKSLAAPRLPEWPAGFAAGRRIVIEADGSATSGKGGRGGRALPADVVFVRQGRRFDVVAPADDGLEIVLPAGAVVERTGAPRAVVGRVGGKTTVRAPGARGERVHVTAFVPDAIPADAEVREAAAFLARIMDGIEKNLDLDGYGRALATDYWSDVLGDRDAALRKFAALKADYARVATRGQTWGADRAGEFVVMRRKVDAREMFPKRGGAAVVPGRFPSIHETWARRAPDGKGWLVVYETDRALDERVGRVGLDGTWRSASLGLVVRAPFARRVVADDAGLADFAIKVPLDGDALVASISVYRRVDEAAGVPALKAADWKRFGHDVMAEGTESVHGRTFPALTTLRDESGVHLATRRVVVRRGEGAVVVSVTGRSTTSRVEALAIVEGHRDVMKAFFDAIGPEEKGPR